MDFASIIDAIHASPPGEWMRTSLKALPIVNALHVMAVAVVFGSIFVVDLRLLGIAGARRPYTAVSREILRWTWTAFAVAAVTGALMFAANANTYVGNTAFKLKLLALLAAGVNMAVFQLVTIRGVAAWDEGASPPLAARAAGALSILLWTSIIVLGRTIGFTKGYNFEVPEDVDLDFEFLEGALQLIQQVQI